MPEALSVRTRAARNYTSPCIGIGRQRDRSIACLSKGLPAHPFQLERVGKASVYKYIPDYFPNDVGAVGGIVGMLGALGGFFLPPAFGILGRRSGVPQLAFTALLAITLWSLAWLHVVVVRLRTGKVLVDSEGHLPARYTTASPL